MLIASTKWILYGTKLILYSTKRILITKLHFFVTKCNFIGLIKIHFVPQKIISRTQLTFLLDEIHCVWYSMGFVWLKTYFVCVMAWIGWKLHLDTWHPIEKSWVSSTTKLRRFLATRSRMMPLVSFLSLTEFHIRKMEIRSFNLIILH